MPISLVEKLRETTRLLLFSSQPPSALRAEAQQLVGILAGTHENTIRQTQDASSRETRTANGLALSPTMASMCVGDFARTTQFIRGTHAAITELRQQIQHRPVRILYAGCGPHAALVLPLLAVFSRHEAVFTLLDIHPESIRSAKSSVEQLGLADSVAGFETGDAGTFCINPNEPPDIILMELMQACLESEPQVAVSRHLLGQAPDAVLIPEEVRVSLVLLDPTQNFLTAGLESNQGVLRNNRITVAPVFVLNREVAKSWNHSCSDRIPASTIRMPESWASQYQPFLSTEIRIYKDHFLRDRESGLTCPRLLHLDDSIAPGVTIDFVYELGDHPQLTGSIRKRGEQE